MKSFLTTTFTIVFSLIGVALLLPPALQAKMSKKQITGHVNLNTATVQEIDQLPGISPKKAQAIVDYRKDKPFTKIEDLDAVKGFSPKSIEKLKPYASLEGATTLKVEGGSKGSHSKKVKRTAKK